MMKKIASLGLAASFLVAGTVPAHAKVERPSAVAAAPTTSPAPASRTFLPPGSPSVSCDIGYACASVPYGNGYYWFKFYRYATYTLYNWYGAGGTTNTQGFGAAMRILGANGGELGCEPPGYRDTYNWTPVYYIRLTSTPC